jgi:hypothetical protein
LALLSEKKKDGGCLQNKTPTLFIEEKSHLIIEKFAK